jgi:Icc-related predicted phosphoesterase
LESTKLPVFGVRGNHDVADPLGIFSRVSDLSGRVLEIAPRLFVVGIGWHGEHFFDLPWEVDIKQLCNTVWRTLLRNTTAADRLILLTHSGTSGVFEWKDGRPLIVNPGIRGAVVEIDMELNAASIR